MRDSQTGRLLLLLSLATIAPLGFGASSSHADPIPPYSVIDLGEGDIHPTTDTGGRGIVVSAAGRATYPFVASGTALGDQKGAEIARTFPPFTNAPVWASMTYGNPKNAFSDLTGPFFLNQKGTFLGTDVYGVAGHIQAAGSTLEGARRQGDGTFGPLFPLLSSTENNQSGGQPAQALALNNRDQILAVTSGGYGEPWSRRFLLGDLNSGRWTDLQTLVPDWHVDWGPELDDEGRLLVKADSAATQWKTHTLLLTPEVLSSDPVPVPEPSTLALLALGIGAGVLRRRSRRRG